MSQVPPPPPPASPPPPPGGAPIGGASAPLNIGDAVGYGWNAFVKNVGPLILVTLAVFVPSIVLNLIAQAAGNTFISLVFSLAAAIVSFILGFGLLRAALLVTRGETPVPADLFKTDGLGAYFVASILYAIGLYIGLILCIVPGIIFVVIFWFYGYVIAESGDAVSPTDALARAAAISKGKRWELFGLGVVLVLINFVGVLACGIGLLFTYGISAIAVAYAYRSLSGQTVVQPR